MQKHNVEDQGEEKTNIPPAKKKKAVKKTTPKSSSTKKRTVSKKKKAGNLKIEGPKNSKDMFVEKRVAFSVSGSNKVDWLSQECLKYAQNIGSGLYLFGTVTQKDKAKGSNSYTIEWENTNLGLTKMDTNIIFEGITLAQSLARKEKHQAQKEAMPLKSSVVAALTQVTDDHETGYHLASDTEDEDFDEDEDADNETDSLSNFESLLEDFDIAAMFSDEISSYKQDGLNWRLNGKLPAPINLSTKRETHLKEATKVKFTTQISSFLAFVPIEFWILYTFRTNSYALWRFTKEKKEGKRRHQRQWKDITLDEFMAFFGILIMMTVRPMPGRRYTDCWDEPAWHPYTSQMDKVRFTEIRSVLHMSEKGTAEENSKDALYKVRPLLNVLKKTLGNYINPGDELALDESSVAARSSYGRQLIFFNNTKPCGKYHFRFYFVCDSETYACLRMRVHTRNGSDFADGLPAPLSPQRQNLVEQGDGLE